MTKEGATVSEPKRERTGMDGWREWDDDLTRLRMLLESATQAAREAENESAWSEGRRAANGSLRRFLNAIKAVRT